MDARHQPIHVLVIDDDLIGLDLTLRYLREYDFAISTADSGRLGLEIARRGLPDLILLDIQMPLLNGFDVLSELKDGDRTRDIPVLLLTARDDIESKMRGFSLGAADFLTKPVAEPELCARVTAHVSQRRLLSSLEGRLRAYEQRFGTIIGHEEGSPGDVDLHRRDVARIYRARRILSEHLAQPPTLNELADLVGTNQPSLSRGFRALFGTTVYGFVREARLLRARELLTETQSPIKTIAHEVGYRNPADLSRGIKERFGMTPSELRACV